MSVLSSPILKGGDGEGGGEEESEQQNIKLSICNIYRPEQSVHDSRRSKPACRPCALHYSVKPTAEPAGVEANSGI